MILSVGRFVTCLHLVELLAERSPIDAPLAQDLLSISQGFATAAIFEDAVYFGSVTELVKTEPDGLGLTASGLSLFKKYGESSLALSRELLFKILTKKFPEYISLAFQNPAARKNRLDADIRACFDECRLLEYSLDATATEWWNRLSALGTYTSDESNAVIGKISEERSLEFELRRLSAEGFKDVSNLVSWVSRENDFAGFDIMSVNGSADPKISRNSALRVEVKTGRMEPENRFSFVISARELEIGKSDVSEWVLHVWLPGLELERKQFRPITMRIEELLLVAPVNSKSSDWQNARLFFDHL
jgi:hypothetical protein